MNKQMIPYISDCFVCDMTWMMLGQISSLKLFPQIFSWDLIFPYLQFKFIWIMETIFYSNSSFIIMKIYLGKSNMLTHSASTLRQIMSFEFWHTQYKILRQHCPVDASNVCNNSNVASTTEKLNLEFY